jgi:predicted ABC-type ATPase
MQRLFIISGCNGAGKTTASYTVLPEILECKEFVNADEIAKGLSPFNPESVAIEAGKIMIKRLLDLFERKQDFAFETTLATRSYAKLITQAQKMGYIVTLLFFWLETPELAVERVAQRVREGGHNIPTETIYRRYQAGIKNLFNIYIPIVDNWGIINSSDLKLETIAEGNKNMGASINNPTIFKKLQNYE